MKSWFYNYFVVFQGCHSSSKAYPGKVALSSLPNSSRNKFVEIGESGLLFPCFISMIRIAPF